MRTIEDSPVTSENDIDGLDVTLCVLSQPQTERELRVKDISGNTREQSSSSNENSLRDLHGPTRKDYEKVWEEGQDERRAADANAAQHDEDRKVEGEEGEENAQAPDADSQTHPRKSQSKKRPYQNIHQIQSTLKRRKSEGTADFGTENKEVAMTETREDEALWLD
ncbi:hypothetical protein LTR99_011012 [Exophiala xenobiotica]|uniref:Uncharacterized protein n=1 Tax=Vermiconidia calcicola TaxID=1690605 RepID=A0AAV9PR15_9PEZI|nr:hypothetical protein LTR99_011012 [Exophiala xenobiotica]KAK5425586.1 hypothetical protein LTR34_010972 [Exophiala xenobiotica]KAK5527716.1 hypothetical protein LTR25_010959 [Vermiconidia calcicola]